MTPPSIRRARVVAAAVLYAVALAAPPLAAQQRPPAKSQSRTPPKAQGKQQALPPAPTSFPHSTGEPWRIVQPPQSTLVFARDGTLIGEIGREWRTSVSLRTLPRYVPQAFIAVEDKRFYQHNGVDVLGVLGALKDAVRGDARGASTITQQLVGNMHPDVIDRRDRSPARKIREQNAAMEMERHYTKEQILETYLNLINFGRGWYGIESAARHYFGKGAAQLTLAEAASLASLPKSPVGYDPGRFPAKNRERRNTVLALMADQKYISEAQAKRAMAEPVVTVPNAGMTPAPYFVDVVRQQAERAGVPIMTGGYRVVTTLDPALQRAADEALVAGTARLEQRPGYRHPTYAARAQAPRSATGGSPYLQGAVVALDPGTGDVLALSGGRSYADSPFDRAAYAVRQPGSAFKPVVYAAAVADSIPPNAIVPDTAIAVPLENGAFYRPDDADNLFLGDMTMREALVKSRNVVAVELAQRVGMDSVIALARRLGIRSPISPYPASAIGASAVRPLELVSAYTAFANLGTVVEPRFVARIEDRAGRTVWAPPASAPSGIPAVDPAVAYVVRDMMRDVVERGTATAVRHALPATVPVAGKTGTTNDNTDVWFVGLTPDVVAGVWLGFDTPKTITPGAAGGSLAAPIFGDMLATWYRTRGVPAADAWNSPPAGVVTADVDRETGRPADAATPAERRYTEFFLAGTEPSAQRVDALKLFQWGPVAF